MYCTTCLCCSLCWAGWRRNCSRSQANASDRARCRHLWRGWWPSSRRSLPHPRRVGKTVTLLLFTGWSNPVNNNPVNSFCHMPSKSLFHLFLMHEYPQKKKRLSFVFAVEIQFFFLPVKHDPITFSGTAQKSAVMLCCTKRREGERQGGEEERREGRQGWCGVCSAKRGTAATFLSVTFLLGVPQLKHLKEQQIARWGFAVITVVLGLLKIVIYVIEPGPTSTLQLFFSTF